MVPWKPGVVICSWDERRCDILHGKRSVVAQVLEGFDVTDEGSHEVALEDVLALGEEVVVVVGVSVDD